MARLRLTLDGRSGGPLILGGSLHTRWDTTERRVSGLVTLIPKGLSGDDAIGIRNLMFTADLSFPDPLFTGHRPDTKNPPAEACSEAVSILLILWVILVAGAGFEPAAFRL